MCEGNNHTQHKIYMVQQYAYVHEVAMISQLSSQNYQLQYHLKFMPNLRSTPNTIISPSRNLCKLT